jgi:elongation factor Ts
VVMTKIDPKDVQRLRSESGAGVMDCKRALEETGGDYAKALALIKERGIQSVANKSEREAKEGLVASYIHSNGRIGALVELASETDFVSRGDDFQKLAQEIAMQVAAMNPANVAELLEQPYIRDGSKRIKDLVVAVAATTKENVHVRRIQRFALGES